MGTRLKILTVFGTRPEAIKLFPLLHRLEADPRFVSRICVSGQHREMLGQVLELAAICPDYDLGLMQSGQSLNRFAARLLEALDPILRAELPDLVVVQGDTSTALTAAIAAHHRLVPVAHVEAGLRSGDISQPWPEEFNRKAIAALADYHFAPTVSARDSLLKENVREESIEVTGNTVVDALQWMCKTLDRSPGLASRMRRIEMRAMGRRIICATCHRRENLDGGIAAIAAAVRELSARTDILIVFPMHPNPDVRGPIQTILGNCANVILTEPLDYPNFVRLLDVSHFVLSDSGGVQEEAPALGTPVLVMRNSTERPEGISAGTARLVGTDAKRIVMEACRLLDHPQAYRDMAKAINPYGDGRAAERIAGVLGSHRARQSIRQAS